MYRSSFHGKIDEIPGIYVDNFENALNRMARAYFLSHYHSDHVQGLHTPELLESLEKMQALIYTSELSVKIIDFEKRSSRLMKYIRGLKPGSTLITLPATKNIPETSITVTLIPAGHSPGSTMFLFKKDTQKVLFTGDFRINCKDLHKYTALHENGEPIKLTTLYMDTTFIELHDFFPKRSESVDELIFHIKKWLNRGDKNSVAIYTRYKYGYEFVFNEIYKQLGFKTYVDKYIWELYSAIPNLVPGVTREIDNTKIHWCESSSENSDHTNCIGSNNQNFLYVYLSAFKWRKYSEGYSAVDHVNPSRVDVCFATHCSRTEIYYFVNYLSPDKIVGFPNKYVEMKYADKVKTELKYDRDSIKGRVDKKVDEKLLKLMFE